MSTPDLVNGAFELFGGVSAILNCRRLLRDKRVQGIDWRTYAFFTSWGFWNLYYYPSLDQWASFVGGVVIVSANLFWTGAAIYYTVGKHNA